MIQESTSTQRRAFLDSLETELAAPAASSRPLSRATGLAAAMLAGASFVALSTTAANADAGAVQTGRAAPASDCMTPDHVPATHVKQCPSVTWVKYWYKYDYSPNGGIVICYVFDKEVNSPCGSGTTPDVESCA